MKHGPLETEAQPGENELDGPLRPRFLQDFQGQSDLKSNLAVFINAAKQRHEAMDHLFISGPPGLGKTTLAGVVAAELGVDFAVTSAPALDKPKDLAGLLTSLNPGALFFIDEIHRLKPVVEEMLYIAMEDFEIDFIVGAGAAARSVRIPLPKFTLVGATTKPGRVSSPLHTRFGISLRINLYTEPEIAQVIRRAAKLLSIAIDDQAVHLLSSCARGTPRVATRLLRRLRDFAQVKGNGTITFDLAKHALAQMRIDHLGLEEQDRTILRVIIENYRGGPVGVETLAIAVGESADSLEDFYEPYLVQRGLMLRTRQGRTASPLAYLHLGLTPPPAETGMSELF